MSVFAGTFLSALILGGAVIAQTTQPIPLPPPDTSGGKPLMQVLQLRQSAREFSSDTLPANVLSNLLWAACGINRPESGKRTAPSAMNWQEIHVYVVTATGVFLYQEGTHSLMQLLTGDLREKTGMQPFVKDAPINLLYVADFARVKKVSDSDKVLYSAADAAFISQNVYLFCASEGLATVVRGSVERDQLAKALKLRADQRIILAQTVGYPRK